MPDAPGRDDPPPAGTGRTGRTLRAPATRDQVDAYRFGQRRLEAALVRADPVPLHEQLRAQRRAAFAGVLLGLLGLVVAVLVAPLFGAHADWRTASLVVGDRSGAMYAVTPAPDRSQQLVPVANAIAGRLVLAALGASGPGSAVPRTVSDDDLASAPRTPPAAVTGAVGVRTDGSPMPSAWAICDTNPNAAGTGSTTVLAGALGAGRPAPGLLLSAQGGSTYVVLDGVRHRIDPDDRSALSALGLVGVDARQVSDGLLSAVPEGPPLRTPDVSGDASVPDLGRAGDVVVSNPLGGGPVTYVVLGPRDGRPGGVLPIPATLADAILAGTGQARPATVAQGLVAQHTLTSGLDVAGWPTAPLPRVDPASVPTVCWTWRDGRSALEAGTTAPVVSGAVTVAMAAADGAGPRLDAVVLPPGGAGPVEARGSSGGGTRWLLSETGSLYGVADDRTAAALGVTTPAAAPEAALRLLPRAGALDVADVRSVVDVPRPG